MTTGPIGVFDVREEIIALSRAGEDLGATEQDLVDPAPVVEDEKAALWVIGDAHAAECFGPPSTDTSAAPDGIADPPTSRDARGR